MPPTGTSAALVLSSASPQRRAILEQLGIPFTVAFPDVEEQTTGPPHELVAENALRKARAAAGLLVLGSDTAVAVGSEVLGKPVDEAQARSFLKRLSGRSHEVWSAVALVDAKGERTAVAHTVVRFRALAAADIDGHLATGEWRGRAGGYAIQGRGAALVEAIEGDYNTVVGLPVAALIRMAPELIRS